MFLTVLVLLNLKPNPFVSPGSEEQTNEEKSQTSSTADKEGQEPAGIHACKLSTIQSETLVSIK